jgi:hypothetical protein
VARVLEELNEEELLALRQAEEQHATDEKQRDEEQRVDETLPISVRRYGAVVGAVVALVDGHTLDLDRLTDLSDDERKALAEFQEVLSGRQGQRFIYAEDRLAGLNHTLAVLQPALSVAFGPDTAVLRRSFEKVQIEINDLRDRLVSLESAEEEHFVREAQKRVAEAGDDDAGDDDAGDDDAGGDDAGGDDAVGGAPAANGPEVEADKPASVYQPDGPDPITVPAATTPSVYEPEPT